MLFDILDKEALGKAVQGCDFVVHAAAMLGVKNTEEHKLECLNANLLGTINVLDACVKGNIKRLVFTSSSEVYGEALNPPIVETSPRSPVSPYGVSKLASEEYIKAYNQKYGLEFSVVRFFNVYGPGQVAQFVMPRFIKNVRQGESPVLYGDGLQVRAFCFVEDAVEGVYKVLNQPAAKNEIFNIGNDAEPITMKELAQKVIAVSGKDIKPVLVPMQDSDREVSREIVKRIPSVQKARQVLGYEPKVSVDDGLKGVDILHVCIPYSKDFIKIIHREIASLQPKLTIIHSTIVPGTTKKLADAFSGMVVHSPARGVHPNLYEGIKTFVKYIGADVEQTGLIAKKHLDGLGITTKIFVPSVTTEVGKLLDTTYYGLAIAWHGEMKKLCDKLGVNLSHSFFISP